MEFLPEIPCTMPPRLPEHEDDAGDGEIELTLTLSPLGRRSGKSSDASRRRSPAEAPKDAAVGVIGEERVAMEASMSESRARDRAAREVEYGDERCVDDRKGAAAAAAVFAQVPYVGHVMPYQTHQQVQYVPVPVPVPNGFGLPYLMPYWAATMSGAAGACRMENASQPLAFGRFPVPLPAVTAGGGCVMVPTDAPGACVVPPAESPGSSSSGISDHRSVSLLGVNASSSGSSDSMKSPSSNLVHKNAAAAQPRRQLSKCENVAVAVVKSRSPSAVAAATRDKSGFPNKSKASSGDAVVEAPPGLSSSRMPCVWTTGSGPNGRTVTGLLHKYDKSGVSIVCTCHRTSFSPAEFVRHAGGGDVAHPLRHIVMVNSISTSSRVL